MTASAAPENPVLKIDSLHVSYGPIQALRGVSLTVAPGRMVAIIGANGAGKTTLMRAISNLLPRQKGEIFYAGQSTRHTSAFRLARAGILHIPEGRGTLQRLTVADNLRLALARDPEHADETVLESVFSRFPILKERWRYPAGNLSGGEQQMLALARALVCRPKLLLLDEPSLGLSPRMVKEAFAILAELKDQAITTVLVEQNARAALALAHDGHVMRQGSLILSAPARDLLNDAGILEHYLGA